jgi:hypothetical protein
MTVRLLSSMCGSWKRRGPAPSERGPSDIRTDPALVPHVEPDRGQQGEALDDLLPVGADVEEVHAVVQHAEDEAADDRAEDGSHAAAHGRAADERRGDGLEFVVQARLRRGRVEAGGDRHARQGRERAHVHEDQEGDLLVLHTGQLGRRQVAADGVDVTAEDGVAHDVAVADHQHAEDQQHDRRALVAGEQQGHDEDRGDDRDELEQEDVARQHLEGELLLPLAVPDLLEHREDDQREAEQQRDVVVVGLRAGLGQEAVAQLLHALRERAEGLALQQDLGEAAEDQHAGEGDDERRYAAVGDEEALHRARHRADQQAQHHGGRPGDVVLHGQHGGERAHERRQRADRQIDVARDDHHHHADGEDQDVAVLQHQVGDVARQQQVAVGEHREQRHDQAERDQHAVLPHVAAHAVQHQLQQAGARGRAALAGRRRGRRLGGHIGAHRVTSLSFVI